MEECVDVHCFFSKLHGIYFTRKTTVTERYLGISYLMSQGNVLAHIRAAESKVAQWAWRAILLLLLQDPLTLELIVSTPPCIALLSVF